MRQSEQSTMFSGAHNKNYRDLLHNVSFWIWFQGDLIDLKHLMTSLSLNGYL